MKILGAFLAFGADCEVGVKALTLTQLAFLQEAVRVCDRARDPAAARADVYRRVFWSGVQYVVPCWMPNAMTSIAQTYEGPQRDKVRGLAACVATGTNYGVRDSDGSSGPSGGQKAPIDPVKPLPNKPNGGTATPTPRKLATVR